MMVVDNAWHSWITSVGEDTFAVGVNHVPFEVAMKILAIYVDHVKSKEKPSSGDIEVASWEFRA